MNYEMVTLEAKTVVGINAHTSNQDEAMPMVIGGLWQQFYQDGIYAQITDKVNEKALGIYSNYASDHSGEYLVTVGCEVTKASPFPNTIVTTIPAGNYAKFLVHGHMQQVVADFWKKLWDMDLDRSYLCDFEEYQNSDMEHGEIHIYISVKLKRKYS